MHTPTSLSQGTGLPPSVTLIVRTSCMRPQKGGVSQGAQGAQGTQHTNGACSTEQHTRGVHVQQQHTAARSVLHTFPFLPTLRLAGSMKYRLAEESVAMRCVPSLVRPQPSLSGPLTSPTCAHGHIAESHMLDTCAHERTLNSRSLHHSSPTYLPYLPNFTSMYPCQHQWQPARVAAT